MVTTDSLELLHAATDRPTIVTVPERRLFAMDGLGDPAGADFDAAIGTLHAVADLLRSRLHVERGLQTRIPPSECHWWMHPDPAPDDLPRLFEDRTGWHWQQMIEVPRLASQEDAEAVLALARERQVRDAELVRMIRFSEGLSAQILHRGLPSTEADSVGRLLEALVAAGLQARGHVHEIYLADPRLVPSQRRRLIVRLPVAAA
jgi:hypothetical protein